LADTANEFLDEVEAALKAIRAAAKRKKKKPAKKSVKKKRK
jgi:hypothetical protein